MKVVKKVFRYGVITVSVILGILVLTWLVLLVYVDRNEKELIGKIGSIIEKKTRGEVQIKRLSVGLFSTFPVVSLQLRQVIVRDSLYRVHGKDLLTASDIYLRAGIIGLITGKSPIGKVIVRNGSINLISDTSGHTNEYVMKRGNDSGRQEQTTIPDVELKNIAVNYFNPQRQKHYQAQIKSLGVHPDYDASVVKFRVQLNMHVKRLALNTKKGAYLRDKGVSGRIDLVYDTRGKNITIHRTRLHLDNHPFVFEGNFGIDLSHSDFQLNISTKNIDYRKATGILTPVLEKKLGRYTLSKQVNVDVQIAGKTSHKKQPLINVSVNTKNSDIKTPFGDFADCTFKGNYSNEMNKGSDRNDKNSLLHFQDFSGKWQNIRLYSRSIKISNLTTPLLHCDVRSSFNLKELNKLTGSETFQFMDGKADLNVNYSGALVKSDTALSHIDGEITFSDASIKYLPRNFLMTDSKGKLLFRNNDLVVSSLTTKVGATRLNMKGNAKNFLSMLNRSPEKLVLNWNISSPKLNLADFRTFLKKPDIKKSDRKQAQFGSAASKVDRMFTEGEMYVTLRAPELEYKTFRATDVKADVILKTDEIAFQNVELKHAGGSMEVSGSLTNGNGHNPATLHAVLRDMDIPVLFAAFNNFGQDAVTYKNLKGKLSANVHFRTAIDNKAELISKSNEGYVNFILQKGELNNFEPLQEISKTAFKKQDFSRIRFADLANRLDIKGTAFIVNHMDIRSTALNFSVEGVYDFKKGTDMSIRLPVSNLTKSQAGTDIGDFGKSKKGVGLRLRAKTGDDGKLKITWDPFRRSIKNKTEVEDSSKAAK